MIMTASMAEKNTGFKRVLKAMFYSYKGISHALKNEAAFRQEAISAAIMIPIACLVDVTVVERILLVSSVFLVLIVELLNTGIEAVVDRVGYERHELAGLAKDMGSAAVLVSIVMCLFIWFSILSQFVKI